MRKTRIAMCAWSTLAGLLLASCEAKAGQQADWAHYGGDYGSKRFAAVSAVGPGNVARLKPTCSILLGDDGPFQTGPLVIGRKLFVTTQHATAAFDAATCAKQWVTRYVPEQQYVYGANRGAAYLNGRLFRGTGDGRLLALDAATGRVLWKIKAVDPKGGEFLSSAPLAWNGLVFEGAAGSDWGVRGRMMAFDAATGRRRWLFYTIPTGLETGAQTWGNPRSTQTGGGAMWTSYTLDPASGELFVPVGNPAPDWDPSTRPGSNLFTDSVVVLDATSGALRWWYQLVPHDSHDYDLGAPPALYTNANGGSMMVAAGKDGFVHFVDRRTHKFLTKTAVTTMKNNTVVPTVAGVYTCPGPLGGTEWNGPSIDEERGLLFVGSVDYCGTFRKGGAQDEVGVAYYGGTWKPGPTKPSGWLTALDSTTGRVRWKRHLAAPVVAGVTATEGGIVFAGDLGGTLHAFASDDGTELTNWKLPGSIAGGIVSYTVDDVQYLAVTSGNISRLTFGGSGSPTLTVYALNASHPTVVDVREAQSPSALGGKQIFATYCAACHGADGAGTGSGPSLKGERARKNLAQTVTWIENPSPPMPKYFPATLNQTQVEAVATFVQSL